MKFRHECKHTINNLDCLLIKNRLMHIAARDSHSGEDGSYYVKSLYFDNYNDKALREKLDGIDNREKLH